MRIIISRTDNIGDVILTLPMIGILKEHLPDSHVIFLGKSYTQAIANSCSHIDEFVNYNDFDNLTAEKDKTVFLKNLNADTIIHVFPQKEIALHARKAGINLRIGTSHRIYNLFTCNKKLNIKRKNSNLHEAQLNIELLKGLNINNNTPLYDLYKYYGFSPKGKLKKEHEELLDSKQKNIILHPKSKGSAREWGLDNFMQLIDILYDNNFKIFVTGTSEEEQLMQELITRKADKITNVCGLFNLEEFILFISKADGLVAASTGPLHIAAAAGIFTCGIYAPMRPIFPQRWAPVGKNAHYLVKNISCDKCRKTQDCECIRSIKPEEAFNELIRL